MITLKVPFNISNYTKCLCPVCPMQADSECVSTSDEDWRQTRKQVGAILMDYPENPETYELEIEQLIDHETAKKHGFARPARGSMRELYCSIGKSACDDLAYGLRCVCSDCAVWQAGGLRKMYFCLQGSSE